MDTQPATLRERKQQRTREAIVAAAFELFEERGFDRVTVTDIAERAEVGRATFFRYFGDKQEVVFGDDNELDQAVREAAGHLTGTPIGDSLPAALALVRRIVVAFIERLVEQPTAYLHHERLVAKHPELLARSLTKQRRYATELTKLLTTAGATPDTALLAAELALACYYAGRATVGDDPARVPGAVDEAFERLHPTS
ncbi:TetR family transcriptional regulator [Kribbella sp. VKM Ac-2527]|uniref:TetR family transcriptional regulator n=1 Tax=Kribbella caucasensis TaxID=2512215 RepID=A0A4R6JKS9_9ACTN|nr:TetR family transcriptional regulator [Kribbella sp. VKM Ac-2527]TDO36312.1 TetR family transcriptional regulator [Kribbella sp. VKM Ac-2527]